MTLTLCSDLSPAGWIATSDLPWQQLVGFGPPGFEAYARLRFLPDPTYPGQSENDVAAESRTADPLRALVGVLATGAEPPDDCYFCVWEGFGVVDGDGDTPVPTGVEDPTARPGLAPSRAHPEPQVAKVAVPHRAYYLFHGRASDMGDWDTAESWPGHVRLDGAEPAFIWPADHTWCIANDVDPHWAGIGTTAPRLARLVADPRLDVVPADPTAQQPSYR